MTLPAWFEDIRIEPGEFSDIPLSLTAAIKEEVHFMSVFRVISQGIAHYVIGSKTVSVSEDKESYHTDSSLLENFDFRAFTASLWKDT